MDDVPLSRTEIERNRHTQELRKAKDEITTVEGLLCGASRALERFGYDFDENPELSEWWAKHRRKDDRRHLKELREAADVKRQEWVLTEATRLMDKPLSEMDQDERAILREANIL